MCSRGEMLGSSDKKVGLAVRKLKIICMVTQFRSRTDTGLKQTTLLTHALYIFVCMYAFISLDM